MVAAKGDIPAKGKKTEKIPDYLVYEELNGMKVYYRGYKDVLKGKQTPEGIIGYVDVQIFLYFTAIGFVQTGVWGGTPQEALSPDEPPKAVRRG